jgi:pullulanase/glycogen debranching enzyme
VFSSPSTNFSAIVNAAVYTINASSNVQNWAGIKNAIGGTVVNQLIVANTFTVTV